MRLRISMSAVSLCLALFAAAWTSAHAQGAGGATGGTGEGRSQLEQQLVEQAKERVEIETGVAATDLTLVELTSVEWGDASLGCPRPGEMYAQVITPGYQILLEDASGKRYDVHTGSTPDDAMLLCTQAEAMMTEPLTGVIWRWQTDQAGDSPNYTIEFLPENQMAIRADCNRGRARYETFGENGLRIDAPAMTRAACPPGSLEGAFLEQVVSSSSYAFDGENLVLYPVVEPGVMIFVPATATPPATDGGEASGRVTGTVLYLERISLPPGSVVRVELQDVSRADAAADVLASQTITTTGENPPIPFELTYDPSRIDPRYRYVVRAEIRSRSGSLLWTSDTAYEVITQGAPTEGVEIIVRPVSDHSDFGGMPPLETGRTLTFRCTLPEGAAFTFTVRTGPGEVGITLPERFGARSLVLPQVPAPSGAQFEEGGVVFWNDGEQLRLEVDGQTFSECVQQPDGAGRELKNGWIA